MSYSAINSEFLPFSGKWMEPELILSRIISQRKKKYHKLTQNKGETSAEEVLGRQEQAYSV